MRQHTAASLFNALHDHLHSNGYVIVVHKAEDLDELEIGQIVEVTGRFLGNPLQILLDFFGQYLAYQDIEERVDEQVSGAARRGKEETGLQARPAPLTEAQKLALEEAKQSQFGVEMIKQMRTDLAEAPVHDAVIEGPDGVAIVLTMSSDHPTRPAAARQLCRRRQGHPHPERRR